MGSVVHEPARRMAPLDSRLEPSPDLDSSLQETAKKPPRGSSRQGARVGSSTPVRAAKRWMPRDSSPLGSCTTLPMGDGRYLRVTPVLTQDCRYLQVTADDGRYLRVKPVLTQDGGYLQMTPVLT